MRSPRCDAARASSPSTPTAASSRPCATWSTAMRGRARSPRRGRACRCRATRSRCPFADGAFDRIIAAEVLEHIPDDRSAIAELARVLQAGRSHGRDRCRRGSPSASTGRSTASTTTSPAGTSASTGSTSSRTRLEDVGLVLRGSHHAHALHSPYWWIRCAGGVNNPDRLLARRYHDVLVWQIMKNPPVLRYARSRAQPGAGQEPRRVRGEAVRPAPHGRRRQARATVDAIAPVQAPDGHIPWVIGGKTDPWNMVEAAMALDVGGRHDDAARAYAWLRDRQLPHGGWYSYYVGDEVVDRTLDTNVSAYIAVGAWHHYLSTGDEAFLRAYVATRRERHRPRDRASRHRAGAIAWRADDPADGALLTGSSSVHMSLRCAIATAGHLGEERPDWELALDLLAHRDRASARRLPRQVALGDGLVLPDPRRRRPRRRRARADRRRLGHVRGRGPRRPLRVGPAVDHGRRDVRAGHGARRDRRGRAGARACSRGRSSSATTTAPTGAA